MPLQTVTIRELVEALESVEVYTRTVKQLLKRVPQDLVITDPWVDDPIPVPLSKGCDLKWLREGPLGPG